MAVSKVKSIKKIISNTFKKIRYYLLPITLFILLIVLTILTYQVIALDRFYLLTYAGDQNISLLTKPAAQRKIISAFQQRASQKILFSSQNQSFEVDLATSKASIDLSIFDHTFLESHKGNFLELVKLEMQTLIFPKILIPKITLKIDDQIATIAKQVEKKPENAQLLYSDTPSASDSANIQIKAGKDGLVLDKAAFEQSMYNYLLSGKYPEGLPLTINHPQITTNNVMHAKETLDTLQKETIKLKFEGNLWVLDIKQLLTLLNLTSPEAVPLDKEKTKEYISNIAQSINQDVEEGLFEFNPSTKRVSAFKASREGRKLDEDKTYQMLTDALSGNASKNINLPVDKISPKIQTQDVNSLGIKELIGRGVSNFAGSIPNRIYNINLTASKINGVLIPPGETFSFNQTVGDISAATGFKQAYVIKSGRTVLDDGGGVCQDSTTLFRAVLNAGLPVLKRTAHAYRVGYYEQGFPPGLDATVFYPSVDFQFKNDTPAHILIQAYTDGLTLYVDLYGTPDGRIAYLTKPVITDQTPPPPDLRQDDPTLPKGTVKQVDFPAWGANVSFKRTVSRLGEILADETWRSSYKAWQAVYLVGTQ